MYFIYVLCFRFSHLSDMSVLSEGTSDELKIDLAFTAVTRQVKKLEEENAELFRKLQGTCCFLLSPIQLFKSHGFHVTSTY